MRVNIDYIGILGVNIALTDVTKLHDELQQSILTNEKSLYLHANALGLNIAFEQSWFRDFLNSAKVVFCDGVGVILAASILGYPSPTRVTYADWMWQLAAFAESNQFTTYFLGASPGVAEKAAAELKYRYPKLLVVGTHHGYFDKSPGSIENEAVIKDINSVKPNIIIIGFGMPVQERWLMENWDRIDANVALTGGAVFDYVSGNLRRAPSWMTDNGLEWLGRVLIEPRRLWRRYLIGNPLFLWRIFLQKFGIIRI